MQKKETSKKNEEIKMFSSGAKSSGKVTRFDFLPRAFMERVAKRFELGAQKYPPFNYRIGFNDKDFVLDRINHLEAHLQAFLHPRTEEEYNDDNLAGIGWAIAFLMELEETQEGRDLINEIRHEHMGRQIRTDK